MEGKENNFKQVFFFDEERVCPKINTTITKTQAVEIINSAIKNVKEDSGIIMDLEILRDWVKSK